MTRPQIDGDAAQVFLGQAAGAEEDLADIGMSVSVNGSRATRYASNLRHHLV